LKKIERDIIVKKEHSNMEKAILSSKK